MSGDEPFLLRWSRRKRDAAAHPNGEKHPPQNTGETAKPGSATGADSRPLTPLPPIEAIGSASDIRAFLAPGVRLELTRAALRRAWTTDPAIRDFVGLSENAWDFTAPNGVPGFGSLMVQEARRLVAQLLDDRQKLDPSAAIPLADDAERGAAAASAIVENAAAVQYENDDGNPHERSRPPDGGALPK